MSQKEGKFQSKSRFGGGKGKGGFKGGGKSGGGGFGKRFEGDRKGGFGGKSKGFGGKSRGFGGKSEGRTGGKPRFDRDERGGDRPDRREGGRPERSGGGDRPFKKREWKPREDRGGDGERSFQKREWKPREDRGGEGFKGRGGGGFKGRSGGGFKSRDRDGGGFKGRDGGGRGGDRPYQKREWKPREEGAEGSFEKREWKPREDRGGDRPPRREGGFKRDGGFKREGGFKPRDRDAEYDQRERSRPRDTHKPYKRYDDKKSFDRKPRRDFDEAPGDDTPRAEASFETKQKLKSERSSYGAPSSAFLYGVHAVTEALKNEKRIHQRLLVTQRGYEAISDVVAACSDEGLNMPQVIYVEKEDIDRLLPRDAVHQDILLDCQPLEETFLTDLLITLKDDENAKVLVLDQVTDPHNVGAIIRTAAAFGVAAVVVQKLNSPDITGIVAKSASGAVEHVPYVRETNLSRSLEQLKEAGFFCIGLDERGKRTIAETGLSGRVALVMGAEGDGLRRLVAENCDELVKLPTQGPIASLNVSNAAAVAVYELIRK